MIPIYREDSYRTELKTIIDAVLPHPDGMLIICRENLYAEGGGQPKDYGSVQIGGEKRAIHSLVKEKGNVALLIDPVVDATKGLEITCLLDFDRRFRIMRLHTAQHIISALLKIDDPSYETKDMAMNEEATSCTLTFSASRVYSDDDLRSVFSRLQSIVAENRSVQPEIFEDFSEAAGHFGETLRFSPSRASIKGRIRFVHVDGIDANPCGGTHVRTTGEIGEMNFVSCEHSAENPEQVLVFSLGRPA